MKNIRLFLILSILFLPVKFYAQEVNPDTMHYWTPKALVGVNFNQVALSNWQGGGQNTIAGAGFVHFSADYKKGIHAWDNKLDAAYGVARIGDKTQPFLKSDDELKISTIHIRAISKHWGLDASADFKTTFMPGYKYGKDSAGNPVQQEKLSEFMSPGYITAGIGFEYKAGTIFSAMLNPVSTRITIVTNDSMAAAGMYGVTPGKNVKMEAGEAIKLTLNLPVMKNILLQSNLDLFGNYKHLNQQVVDWTMDINFKVNSIFTAKFGTHLIYDHDIDIKKDDGSIGPAIQFKEVIGLGIAYKLY